MRSEVVAVAVANGTAAAIHADAVRLDPPELVHELVSQLGSSVVAALAGVRDRKQPYKWASAGGATPRNESLTRLQVAYRAWRMIADVDGEKVARSWFIGANPRFREQPPYMAIREDQFTEVLAAAEEFVDR